MSHLLGTMRKYAISNGMFHMLVILVDTRLNSESPHTSLIFSPGTTGCPHPTSSLRPPSSSDCPHEKET